MKEDVLSRLREFIENEVRSGSMDFGCITPLYIYRMLGGAIPMVKGVWAYCSYLFVPQCGKHRQ